MKLRVIIALPLLTALVLAGTFYTNTDNPAPELQREFVYKIDQGVRSFDETVWTALSDLSRMDGALPEGTRSLRVDITSNLASERVIQLSLDRDDLQQLVDGQVQPENFIRDHVQFN